MAYRKIEVNGTEYRYVVGLTHIKIKGVGVFNRTAHGELFDGRCECCGEGPYNENTITPKEIRKIILNNVAPNI